MKKIEFPFNCNIENAVEILIEYNVNDESVYGIFNGHRLESDNISLDKAYFDLTGKSYGEFRELEMRIHFEYEKREREYKKSIPQLTKKWIEKGHEILNESYWEDWDACVPIRLNDLYHGMELGNCLDIVKVLNEGGTFEEACVIIDNQGHSGMSYSLVISMIKAFCDRGEMFANSLK